MSDTWHLPDPDTQPEFYTDVPFKRAVAWVIDTLLITLACVVLLPFTAFTGLLFFPAMLLVVGFAYRIITIARGSATWGMAIMAIEFRDRKGRRFDTQTAVLHTFGYTVSWALPLLQLASVFLMATGPRAQGLTDILLDTVAVNRRAAM